MKAGLLGFNYYFNVGALGGFLHSNGLLISMNFFAEVIWINEFLDFAELGNFKLDASCFACWNLFSLFNVNSLPTA